jgi:hypothetical protein
VKDTFDNLSWSIFGTKCNALHQI